jgi:hypothetical protein
VLSGYTGGQPLAKNNLPETAVSVPADTVDTADATGTTAWIQGPLDAAGTAASIQAAIDALQGGTVNLPPGKYALGTTGLRMKTGVGLQCADPIHTLLFYEGNAAAVLFDSVISASLTNCQIRLDGTTAAQAIRITNQTSDTMWNTINNVLVVNSSSAAPVPGQIGLQLIAVAKHALYWNAVENLHIVNTETGVQVTNVPGFAETGPNDNTFTGVTVHHCKTGMEISNHATENRVFGLSGSASGLTDENTLLLVGDTTGAPANFNMIFGLVSDQGPAGRAWIINKGVTDTLVIGTDQSGKTSVDLGTNSLIERVGAGTSTLKVPQLTSSALPKHLQSKLGCTTAAVIAATCTSPPLKWSNAFADANYTVSCTLYPTSGQPHIASIQQASGSITVTIATDKAVGSTGSVSCIAVHN